MTVKTTVDLASGVDQTVLTVRNPPRAISDVLLERGGQIQEYGLGHDDDHLHGELAQAAASLTCGVIALIDVPGNLHYWLGNQQSLWPEDWAPLRAKGKRQDLVRAAALLIAEIERLDRMEARDAQGTGQGDSPPETHA